MRRWLEGQLRKGTIELRNGKLDRKAFERKFRLRDGAASYPRFRALLEEFDQRAAHSCYQSNATNAQLRALQALLESADCPLGQDAISVNISQVSTVLDVPAQTLSKPPYMALIATKIAQLAADAEASQTTCLIHGRPFGFSHLLEHWPKLFVRRLTKRFKEHFAGKARATTKAAHSAILRAFVWLGSTDYPPAARVVAACQRGDDIAAQDWEDAAYGYREVLLKATNETSTNHKDIRTIGAAFDVLGTAGVVPPLPRPLVGIKNARRRGGHRKSLAEVSPHNIATTAGDAYIAFAKNALAQARKKFKIDTIVDEDASTFLASLADEAQRTSVALPADPAVGILQLLTRRLSLLTTHANIEFGKWRAHFERGESLLDSASIQPELFFAKYFSTQTTVTKRSEMLASTFPTTNDAGEEAIANLLKLTKVCFFGMLPVASDSDYGGFFTRRCADLGGFPTLDAYLNLHPDGHRAALTLYLCESGANLTVGRTLDANCISPSDIARHKQITGHKARARGKPIVVDLPNASPAVEAMQWIATYGAVRRHARPADTDRLFVLRAKDGYRLMSEKSYTDWFKRFVASIPELQGLGLLPSMIRPTVLLRAALENDGRLQVGIAIGQHTESVSSGYQNKWPTRLLYDQRIRAFQEHLEVVAIQHVQDAPRKLGISQVDFDARRLSLMATGLGTFCKDPLGRTATESQACRSLDCWNDCPQLVVIADIEAIASLQIWQASLRRVRADWERDRPERWDAVWLPWLCLTDVVEEKMSRGSLLKVWNQAQIRRGQIEASPTFIPPAPF